MTIKSTSQAVREQDIAVARQQITQGREAIGAMKLLDDFFAEELALAFEQFLNIDMAQNPAGIADLHYRARVIRDLHEHFEQVISVGNNAAEILRNVKED